MRFAPVLFATIVLAACTTTNPPPPSPSTTASCAVAGSPAQALAALNDRRRTAGLAPLAADPRLQAAAQAQACDNARSRSYSHTGTDGSDLRQRLQRAGYRFREGAENTYLGQADAAGAVDWWLTRGSPYHRDNALNPGVRQAGFGIAATGDGRRAWVLVVGRAR